MPGPIQFGTTILYNTMLHQHKKLSIIDAIGHYSKIRKNVTHREQKTEKQITEATLIANGLPG